MTLTGWGLAWALFKRFWWVLPLVAGLWYVYDWVYERGSHSRDKEVMLLRADRDKFKGLFDAQAKTLEAEKTAHETAVATLKKDQGAIVAGLTDRLNAAEKKAAKAKAATKEVVKYVSKESDTRYPVPYGFVRLHNDSLGAEGPTGAAAVPGSGPPNDDAPASIAISAVGAVIRDNYAECTARGEVIKAWQDWFPKMQAAWEKAVKIQSDFKVVSP